MGQVAFLMTRLDNVRSEFSLTALGYNMRRAINLVGVPKLVAAVRACSARLGFVRAPSNRLTVRIPDIGPQVRTNRNQSRSAKRRLA